MGISNEDFRAVSEFIHKEAAIVLDAGKEYLVEARLLPLVSSEGYNSLSALVSNLRLPGQVVLRKKVVDALTTNETSFFRDILPFNALEKAILPALIESRRTQRRLTIWSAACSTGQEPYSIAMMIREKFPELATWDVKIVASDISPTVLEKARGGSYTQSEVNRGLPAPYLVKYFERNGMQWSVKSILKQMVVFHELNLIGSIGAIPKCDVVFIRNVLIYFDIPTKRMILEKVKRVMHPDSVMVLGTAETTLNIDDGFDRKEVERTHVYGLRR